MALPLQLKEYTIAGTTIGLYEPVKEVTIERYQKGEIPFPYWSQVWPAAIALTQFLLNHLQYIKSKKVLELAAGLGLPSLVIASHAQFVIVSDNDVEAVATMQLTVAFHRLQNVQVQLLDWTTLPAALSAEILLVSDVSYDPTLFAIQEKVIRQFLEKGTTIIISTPQRLVAKEAITPLLPFCTHQEEIIVQHHATRVAVTIMVLESNNL